VTTSPLFSLPALSSSPSPPDATLCPYTTLFRSGPDELVDRLPGVLRVISLIFTHGINATSGATHTRVDLQKEAIRLARLLAELLPAETEVRGLLALLLLTHARDRARVSADGS